MKTFTKNLAAAFLIFIIANCSLLFDNCKAQWIQTNGPYGGIVNCFVVSGTNLFAGTDGGGVFLSTNNGTSWTVVNNGLTSTYVSSFAVSGTNLFAGTYGGGVSLSTNNGTSWTAVNNGLTSTSVWSLVVSGTNLFAGTSGGGVFLSTNNGTNWTAVNTGMTNTDVWSLAVSGTNLFAGTYEGGVFLSTNNGTSWTAVNNGLTNTSVPISVQSLSTEVPEQFSLSQNYPNPFNPVTNLEFGISDLGFVTLKIYDVLGKEDATLVNEKLSPGNYKVVFDGSGLPSGVYFYRLTAGEFTDVKRMMLVE